MRRAVLVAASVALAAVLSGCGLTIPADPDGSLTRIDGGVLRAGVAEEPGLAEMNDGELEGPLVDLIEEFADEHAATVQWSAASEESLVVALEDGNLDIAIGGMTDQTAWVDRAGVTRGYSKIDGANGRSLIMLVPLGENRLLSTLEEFLDRAVAP